MAKYKVTLDSAEITCKPNSILSCRVYRYLLENGHEIEKDPAKADYIIVNTCGFDQIREDISCRLFQKHNFRKNKTAKIISIGCLNKINENSVKTSLSDVVLVSDLSDLDKIFFNKVRFGQVDQA